MVFTYMTNQKLSNLGNHNKERFMGMLLRRHYPPKKTATVEETDSFSDLNVKELKELAKQRGIKSYSTLTKQDLLEVLNG